MKYLIKLSKKELIRVVTLSLFILVAFLGSYSYASAFSCSGSLNMSQIVSAKVAGLIITDIDTINGQATAEIINKTSCPFPVTLMAWKTYDKSLATQKAYDVSSRTVSPNSTTYVDVDLPTCRAQIDLYYGGPRSTPVGDVAVNIDWKVENGNYCSDSVPLSGSCSVNPSSVSVNGYLNWSSTASGGTGSYTYSWSGTDGLSGNSSSVSRTYQTAGTKTGTVTITSGSQSVTRTCSAAVTEIVSGLSVSCSVDDSSVDVDEDVTYTANVSGGSGSYSYDWTGSESLRGSSRNVTWSYDNDGTKNATVTVTSGSQSATASCSVRVREEEEDDLSVRCYANPTNPQVGQQMNWYADVSGGSGSYRYSWDGSDDLDSSSRSPAMTYYSGGRKNATVEVRSGGQTDSATCYANVNQNTVLAFSQSNPVPLASAVYLSQVPYTGLADNLKLVWFILGLILFSAYVTYVIISYKKSLEELS